MAGKDKSVQEYLEELERSKKDKPEQIREALEIYWSFGRRPRKRRHRAL